MSATFQAGVFLNRLMALGAALLSLAMAGFFLIDYWNTLPEKSWPIVEGSVTDRHMVSTPLGGNRTRLTIQVQPDGPTTYAVLSMNASGDIPNAVHFRFGGDPFREVVLEEETSSLVGGVLFLFLPLALAAAWPSYERHVKKKRE